MNQPKPEQEPSMEEILASIRRIISEDGDETEPAAEAIPAEAPPVESPAEPIEAEAPAVSDDDVLELTEVVSEQPLAAPEPAPEPEPEPLPEPEPDPEPEPVPETETALDFAEPDADDEPLEFETPSTPPEMEEPLSQHPAVEDDSLVADSTALMASAAMSKLTESPSEGAADAGPAMQIGDKTIEALVRELMRPMLKEWLDRNLPAIVERIVEREVSRVAERLHNN